MTSDVPAWAYERVEICPYEPRWIAWANVECARLADLLAPWLLDGPEHVGSTAVPGLAAKPVVDLMVLVADPDLVADKGRERLGADGWCYVPPELDGQSWRRFFVKPDTAGRRREAHLHVIQSGQPRWTEQIRFRDALRRDGLLAQEYEDLKRRLAKQYEHDREAYTNGKAEFVAEVLRVV